MYKFRDVNESFDNVTAPREAMQFDGVFLETEIEGYRTLYVKGRESLSPEFDLLELGSRDGSISKGKRYPARTITVGYQLIAKDEAAFRAAYNRLGGMLGKDNAEIIFNDEPDKYFVGSVQTYGEVEPGRNAITAEIEIICLDPFKYSVSENEVEPSLDDPSTFLLDYQGTYPAHPKIEAKFYEEDEASGALTGAGDCGYIAFFTEDEKILQFGDPDEIDGEVVQGKSETLISQSFNSSTDWGDASKALWQENTGVVIPEVGLSGELGMSVAEYVASSTFKPTSGTLLSRAKSSVGSPYAFYTLSYKVASRTEASATIDFIVTSSLQYTQSWLGTGYGLRADIYIGGAWRSVTLKTTSQVWRGQTGHTASIRVTVSGLSASTTSISGIRFRVVRTDGIDNSSSLSERAVGSIKFGTYVVNVPGGYCLQATTYGDSTEDWHGVSISRTIRATQDFNLAWKQKLSIGSNSADIKQRGAFQMVLSDSADNIVTAVQIVKSADGKIASVNLYVGDKMLDSYDVDVSYGNKLLSSESSEFIAKQGENFTFNVGGVEKSFKDSSLKDVSVTRVTVCMLKHKDAYALSYNGISWVRFISNARDSWHNLPNKFSSGDVLVADCSRGEVFLNGNSADQLGALGNDWEDFVLKPGINQIGVAYSSWVDEVHAPAFTLKYREVYL